MATKRNTTAFNDNHATLEATMKTTQSKKSNALVEKHDMEKFTINVSNTISIENIFNLPVITTVITTKCSGQTESDKDSFSEQAILVEDLLSDQEPVSQQAASIVEKTPAVDQQVTLAEDLLPVQAPVSQPYFRGYTVSEMKREAIAYENSIAVKIFLKCKDLNSKYINSGYVNPRMIKGNPDLEKLLIDIMTIIVEVSASVYTYKTMCKVRNDLRNRKITPVPKNDINGIIKNIVRCVIGSDKETYRYYENILQEVFAKNKTITDLPSLIDLYSW